MKITLTSDQLPSIQNRDGSAIYNIDTCSFADSVSLTLTADGKWSADLSNWNDEADAYVSFDTFDHERAYDLARKLHLYIVRSNKVL